MNHLSGVNAIVSRAAALLVFCGFLFGTVQGQCEACEADPGCTSGDGFPTLCPLELPGGTAGEYYESVITFFLPAEITDPGSGLVATLNSVQVASITGIPPGLTLELDDEDAFYEPASGQNSGCATLCGDPTFSGAFEIQISIMAVVTALGFEQDVPQGFALPLIIAPGSGGTSSFSFSPASGCGTVSADFEATVFGEGNQITDHTWVLPSGAAVEGATLTAIEFNEPGAHVVVLETTILNQTLEQVQLTSTTNGGWDDFWQNPDPYFTLKDANESVVYTSSTVDASTSATWSGLGIVLNNPPYSIDFYDEDLLDGDDWLGWTSITPNGPGTISLNANPSSGVATIGMAPIVVVVDSAEVWVNALPEVELVQSSPSNLMCTNDSLIQYQWWWGDSLVVSGGDPVFSPEISGFYSVLGLDSAGCSAESEALLFCMPNAQMDIELVEANGSPMALVTASNRPWWVWHVNGVVMDTMYVDGETWFPLESGWYWVDSETDLGCPTASDSMLVCWPLVSPELSQNGEGDLVVDGDFALYQWWLNGAPIEGEAGSTLVSPGEGEYAVYVADMADCPAVASAPWTVVGMEERAAAEFQVMPNPFVSTFRLEVNEAHQGGQALVMSFTGQVLFAQSIFGEAVQVSMDAWPAGVYLVSLVDAQGRTSATKRVIKQSP
jgi:hypothetical protein